MKNFVKHTLAIAICAAALLSSCIKEQPYELKIAQLEVAVTRADASSTSQEQGDGIGNAMFWVFKCSDLNADGSPSGVDTGLAASWRVMHTVNQSQSMTVHMELPLCDTDHQDYILVAILNTDAFGDTIKLDQYTKFADLQQALFDASSADFWNEYPVDKEGNRAPWKMPISNWKTFTVTNDNTHPSDCYKLNLPVYRAVAKTQLFVKPKSNNFTVTVTDAKIHSAGMPTKGAILTANTANGLDNNNIDGVAVKSQQGNAGENVTSPAVYPTFPYGTSAGTRQLYNAVTADRVNDFADVKADTTTYTWAGSTFIYENAQVLDNTTDYKTVPTGNQGYYMQISYQVSGDSKPYTRYVALPQVVRNHDYQIKATVDAGGEMTLNLLVNEWKESELNLDYQNTVTVTDAGQMRWTELPDEDQIPEGGFAKDDNGNVIGNSVAGGVINMTYAKDNYATCTFALNTPVGGTWHAELITLSGQPGAIQIVSANSGVADQYVDAADKTSIDASGTSAWGPISPSDADGTTHTGIVTLRFKTTLNNTTTTNNIVELRITAEGYWGGKKRTYQVNGLTGLDGISFYKLDQGISL